MKNFLLSLALISNLSAFSFDGWFSDTNLTQIKEQAKERGIILQNENNLNRINKYDKTNINTNKIVYTYNTNLLNRNSKINLYFDLKDKKLYKAEANFNLMGTNTGDFVGKVYDILDQKYGGDNKEVHYYTDFWGNTYAFEAEEERNPYDTKYWHPDAETFIIVKTAFSAIKVIYTDPRLYDEENNGYTSEEKSIVKDFSRF